MICAEILYLSLYICAWQKTIVIAFQIPDSLPLANQRVPHHNQLPHRNSHADFYAVLQKHPSQEQHSLQGITRFSGGPQSQQHHPWHCGAAGSGSWPKSSIPPMLLHQVPALPRCNKDHSPQCLSTCFPQPYSALPKLQVNHYGCTLQAARAESSMLP